MSYQVALDSRNVLVPITLEGRDGTRLDVTPSRLDTATAMVIAVKANGAFSQEFIPLRITADPSRAYAGTEWELRAHQAGRDHTVFYLGIPDRWFAAGEPATGDEALKSLSIEVVGSSPMTGRQDYSGGVDVSLQSRVQLPLVPGFLGLGERFFPTLLPHNFVESWALESFAFGGREDLVLKASLQADPASDRLPMSLGKHWDPKNWVGAAVENLVPDAPAGAYHVVRGGCFYARNRRVTHWFGSGIGLEDRGFRQAAGERLKALGPGANGAWVFWLDPQGRGLPAPAALAGLHAAQPQARFSLRHPMLHRVLGRVPAPARSGSPARANSPSIAQLPAESAVAALAEVARILAGHQAELYRARTEPAHDLWSEQAGRTAARQVADALAAAERSPSGAAPRRTEGLGALESAIRDLYRRHGEALRALETAFDETGAYAAWDAPGHPLRDLVEAYLSEGAEARAPA